MIRQPHPRRASSLGALLPTALVTSRAQTTTILPTAPKADDEPITFSPFTVRADTPENAFNRNTELYLALKHDFRDASALTLSGEYFLQERQAPSAAAPIITDLNRTASNLDDVAIGYAKILGHYDPYGPQSEFNKSYVNVSSTYEKRLDAVWSTRLGLA